MTTSSAAPAVPARRSPHTPVAQYLSQPRPGVTADGYVVLPRGVLDDLPAQVQHQIAAALAAAHAAMPLTWTPIYQVTPSYWAAIDSLDQKQLQEVGILTELDTAGTLVYRELSTGRRLTDAETSQSVLVRVSDPLQTGAPRT